jgi:hypothetical protein
LRESVATSMSSCPSAIVKSRPVAISARFSSLLVLLLLVLLVLEFELSLLLLVTNL